MIKLYHNHNCGTSRGVLEILKQENKAFEVVEYMKIPFSLEALSSLWKKTGKPARGLLREKEPLCLELGLLSDSLEDIDYLKAIVAHPILLNRPVVETADRALVCRPAEKVMTLLATSLTDPN